MQLLICLSIDNIFWGDKMQEKWKEVLIVIVLGVVLPWTMFSFMKADYQAPLKETVPTVTDKETTTATTSVETEGVKTFSISVLMPDGTVEKLDLDTYITRVVLQEMPAEFEEEALKAQAVVARTYALRRFERGGKHANAAVCTDSACCQGYCTEDAFIKAGESKAGLNKVVNAVKATTGKVITYNSELAEATYFSCSGGKTEDAQAVWGSDIPYLQSVNSDGEESATHYTDTITMTTTEFADKIGEPLDGVAASWIGAITYTDGGGVDTITICNRTYKGTEVRALLSLRSTAFAITILGDTVTITTKGFGHRVGMSQYGADAMAVQGSGYQDILAYYYKGIELTDYVF